MALKRTLLNILPDYLIEPLSNLWSAKRRKFKKERSRIARLPRYTPGVSALHDIPIRFPDSASYLWMEKEIFADEIYRFDTHSPSPLIYDCGANIGLSAIYFLQRFPQAEIHAYEPDDSVFDYLKLNTSHLSSKRLVLHNSAVWTEECDISFEQDGADAGRINLDESKKVKAIRLADLLTKKISLLKIDIEGAELEVLRDCEPHLHYVERIFVEYHSMVDCQQDLDELLRILKKSGFRYYISQTGVRSRHPLVSIAQTRGMDLQLNIFAFRP